MDQILVRTSSYPYKPLSPQDRHIRLLTLYPSFDETTTLKFTIALHSLDLKPVYEALSYTWGGEKDICATPIELDGFPTTISNNLDVALRVLRLHDKPRELWIDALCINQQDCREQSSQVAMMGTIFEQAENVIIWLGPTSTNSDLAMSVISRITGTSCFESFLDSEWDALDQLFSRPWFSRVWVLQEFKRAKNPTIQCGYKSFKWSNTGSILRDFWSTGHQIQVSKNHARLLGDFGKVVSMASTRDEIPLDATISNKTAAAYLVKMLRLYGSWHATIPQDKVYGLLGLSSAFAFKSANPPKVDYNKNFSNVYTDWARSLIATQDSLVLLYASQGMQRDPSLPSWVPDWRTGRHELLITLDIFPTAFGYSGLKISHSKPNPIFIENGRHLVVEGILLQTLERSTYFTEDIQSGFIESFLEPIPREDLLQACLMMGCVLKKFTADMFSTMGISLGRKQFWLSSGITGLVPKTARHGDVICMLSGAVIPFVLRPAGTEYLLIGDAYTQMPPNVNKRRPQHFTIR